VSRPAPDRRKVLFAVAAAAMAAWIVFLVAMALLKV
jgi:hypothetical protein